MNLNVDVALDALDEIKKTNSVFKETRKQLDKSVKKVPSVSTQYFGRRSSRALRQRRNQRLHLGMIIGAHRCVGAAVGQPAIVDDIIDHVVAMCCGDEIQKLCKYQTLHGMDQSTLWKA